MGQSEQDDAPARRGHAEDAIVLGLLTSLEANASATQRGLAKELGIALGLANTYVKRCVRKGFLKISDIPAGRYAYYLTPKGFTEKSRLTAQYLTASLGFLRRARGDFSSIFTARGLSGTRFVLIGAGDLAEIALLVARSMNVQVVAVVPASSEAGELASSLADVCFDFAIVTATELPLETYLAATAAFGHQCVCAPSLLRIKATMGAGAINGHA